MEKKDKPQLKSSKAPPAPDIELLPDAWERFEKAVDRVSKSPPQHRKAKKVSEDGSLEAKQRKEGR